MKVRVDRIRLLRTELRFALDERETQILADDLARQGQIQPIAVRQIDSDWWELVAGRRRWEAAKILGWTEIEAFEGEYREGILVAAAAENIRRKQLTLLEEAAYVEKLHGDGKMSIGDIAEATGHGTSWVQDRLALLNYPKVIKDLVHDGHIKLGAASQLSKITDRPTLEWLCHCAKAGGCTAQTAEAWYLDWYAREKMAHTDDYDGIVPQPLPLPVRPPTDCFLCGEKKQPDDIVVIRACVDCVNTVQHEKHKAMALLPPTQETSSTEVTQD